MKRRVFWRWRDAGRGYHLRHLLLYGEHPAPLFGEHPDPAAWRLLLLHRLHLWRPKELAFESVKLSAQSAQNRFPLNLITAMREGIKEKISKANT